ncbi:MAG: hypothetical protein VB855_14845 [Pirellulaceae bacterium]
MSIFCSIDDKRVPLYRILWISEVPHFCGDPECECEGRYEIRLEQGESVWANSEQRDHVCQELEKWGGRDGADEYWN